MTQKEFDGMPGLLQRKQFQNITGLSDRDLDGMTITCNALSAEEIERVRAHGLLPVFRPGLTTDAKDAKGKYYKADAARIANFKL